MKKTLSIIFFLINLQFIIAQEVDTTSNSIRSGSILSTNGEPDTLSQNKTLSESLKSSFADSLETETDLKTDLQYYYTFNKNLGLDSSTVQFFKIENEWYSPTQLQSIDTSLNDYNHTNRLYQDGNFYQSLGAMGHATQSIIFNPRSSIGFEYGKNSFDVYSINENNLKFYNSYTPFTEIYYRSAPEKEQEMNVALSQSVYKDLTVGMDIQIMNTPGPYLDHETNSRRVAFTSHYISDNKRYTAAAFYSHNKYDVEENGGIVDDYIFEGNIDTDRQIYDVNLTNSATIQKESTLYLKHAFELSPTKALSDSIEGTKKTPFNFGRLQHTIKYYRESYSFIEEYSDKNDFYANHYLDTLSTYDTSYYRVLENTFSWQNSSLFRTKKSLGFDFGLTHRFITFQDSIINQNYNQIILHGRLSKSLYGDLKIGGEAEYVQGDINANDFKIGGIISNKFTKNLSFIGIVNQISRDPNYFFTHYYSNHFQWDKSFDKENIIHAGGTLKWNKITVGANYYLLSNYTYLNTDIEPKQAGKSFSVLQLYIAPSFNFGNFHWDANFTLQEVSDDEFLQLPFAAGTVSFNYKNTLFDKALYYQLGVDANYRDIYYTDSYMPALQSFYRQDSKKTGNFVYGDVYVSLKIKRARILFKYRHVNQGLSAYNYYGTPHYPLQDSGLEFAISWRFHD